MYLKHIFYLMVMLATASCLYFFQQDIAESLMNLFKYPLQWIDQRNLVHELSIATNASEPVFKLRLVSEGPVHLYSSSLPHLDIEASTLVGHALSHCFLIFAICSAAFFYTSIHALRLALLAPLAIAASCMLDIPFVLMGSIEGLLFDTFSAPGQYHNIIIHWEKFMTQGGRYAIAITLALFCICASRKYTHYDAIYLGKL